MTRYFNKKIGRRLIFYEEKTYPQTLKTGLAIKKAMEEIMMCLRNPGVHQ
jgi:hypothetical protein